MTDNPCLRPATISDIYHDGLLSKCQYPGFYDVVAYSALKDLYNAEWAKRGYRRSP